MVGHYSLSGVTLDTLTKGSPDIDQFRKKTAQRMPSEEFQPAISDIKDLQSRLLNVRH